MAKTKDFSVGGPPSGPVSSIFPSEGILQRKITGSVLIALPHGRIFEVDFTEYLGQGFDDTVLAIVQVLRIMVDQGKPEPISLKTIVDGGLLHWLRFCSIRSKIGFPPSLTSIDGETVNTFVGWLSTRVKPDGEVWSRNTARTVFQKVKTVLQALVDRKLLPKECTSHRNPFPGATSLQRRRNYIRPLSDTERERILRPLAAEVAQVFDGTHSGSVMTQLALCIFAVLLKTGVNPTPFLELPRDLVKCFLIHPRVNRRVLVTYKRRAGVFTTTPLESSETRVVSLDVYRLCERAVSLSSSASQRAVGTPLEGSLWIYEDYRGVRGVTTQSLSSVATLFTVRHKLVRDDGTRLKMSSQLFRNSKLNRVWRASKGDLLATAKSGSNTPAAAERYLSVTPEMLEEHRIAGEILVDTLSGVALRDLTPHSGCKDAFNGEFAPKDGTPCMDFLSCFRCKSQVIIQDDLYKLFSFYWALLAQRAQVGHDNWRKLFSWVVKVIDRDVAPRFDQNIVELERARARLKPHPMWRSPSGMAALSSVL